MLLSMVKGRYKTALLELGLDRKVWHLLCTIIPSLHEGSLHGKVLRCSYTHCPWLLANSSYVVPFEVIVPVCRIKDCSFSDPD